MPRPPAAEEVASAFTEGAAPTIVLFVDDARSTDQWGPVTFDGCNSYYIGTTVGAKTGDTFSHTYVSEGLSQWQSTGDLTQFAINLAYNTESVQDAATGRLYVWGPGVVNLDRGVFQLGTSTDIGTTEDGSNGAGQLWSTADGKTWEQLLGSGQSYNTGRSSCFFKGSIYAFGATTPIYSLAAQNANSSDGDLYEHLLRLTPGVDRAWIDVTNSSTGLDDFFFIDSCTVTSDGSTMLLHSSYIPIADCGLAYPLNINETIYATTDGLTYNTKPTALWAKRFRPTLVTVGSDIVMLGGYTGVATSNIFDDFLTDTWKTSDAGETWTEIGASSFGGGALKFTGAVSGPPGVTVLDEQLYIALAQPGDNRWIQSLATLGSSFDFDQASCKVKVAAAKAGLLNANTTSNGTSPTGTPSKVQSGGTTSQPAMYAAFLVTFMATLLLQ